VILLGAHKKKRRKKFSIRFPFGQLNAERGGDESAYVRKLFAIDILR
jgi:hypothetical protein